MELAKNLKIGRASLRRCMTRLEKLITEGSLAPAEIDARSDRLKALMSRYDNLHETLDEHEKDHEEFNDLDELHDTYYALIAKLSENTNRIASTSSTTTSCATHIETPRLISLPRINIPKFDGNFEKWIPYRDGFMTLVGSRTDINELEKLEYLRESLLGLPRETVSQFSVKEGSYKLAWEALLVAYDRKRLLLAQHVDALLATQKPKITNLKGMTRLINDTCARIRAIDSLDLTPHTVITRVIENAIPDKCRDEWEKRLNPDVFPTIDEILGFLNNVMLRKSTSKRTSREPERVARRNEYSAKLDRQLRGQLQSTSRETARRVRSFVTTNPIACILCRKTGHSILDCI
ncbi:hypothetical protein M0802_016261 [Mischocyttarus mexicanus]|nr:hypothetical protein M0802_016261 [Mischocyttarus mexicanus]